MKYVAYFLFLATAVVAEDLYQQHLPKELYEYLLEEDSFDANCLMNSLKKQHGSVVDSITVEIGTEERRQYAQIDYRCQVARDNFAGTVVAFRNGALIAYVYFDGMGRDYIAYPPFSKEDALNVTAGMLTLMNTGEP